MVETGYDSILEAYEQNFFNPMCFLQYYDPLTPPSDFDHSKVNKIATFCLPSYLASLQFPDCYTMHVNYNY